MRARYLASALLKVCLVAAMLRTALLQAGWSWSSALVLEVVRELAREGIGDPEALIGADVNDIEAAAQWPADVREFIQKLADAASCHDWQGVESRQLAATLGAQLQTTSTTMLDVKGLQPRAALEKLRPCLVHVRVWAGVAFAFASCQGRHPRRQPGQSSVATGGKSRCHIGKLP